MVIGALFGGLAADDSFGMLLIAGGTLFIKDAFLGFISSVINMATFGDGAKYIPKMDVVK